MLSCQSIVLFSARGVSRVPRPRCRTTPCSCNSITHRAGSTLRKANKVLTSPRRGQ